MFRGLRELLRSPASKVTTVHPDLGMLEFDHDGSWNGRWTSGAVVVDFEVPGNPSGPHTDSAKTLLAYLSRLPGLRQEAIELIGSLSPKVTQADLLSFHLESAYLIGSDLVLCFRKDHDVGAIWRVEFAEGRPKYFCRDD